MRLVPKALFLALASLVLVGLLASGTASAAKLDPSFGDHGVITLASENDYFSRLALDHAGRIDAMGNHYDRYAPRNEAYFLRRYLTGGTLDSGFGESGVARPQRLAYGQDIAIQPNGKFVIAAGATSLTQDNVKAACMAVARVNRDGSPDLSFGEKDGYLRQCLLIPFPGGGAFHPYVGLYPRAVDIARRGKIVVGGYSPRQRFDGGFVARYSRRGNLDRSFIGDRRTRTPRKGIVQIATPTTKGTANIADVESLRSGRTLVGGTFHFRFMVARLRRDGSYDRSFGRKGRMTVGVRASCCRSTLIGRDLARDRHGRILLAGHGGSYSNGVFALARFHRDGRIDRSFGHRGVVRTKPVVLPGSLTEAYSVAVQRNGRIVVGGESGNALVLVRYKPDGSLDHSFFGDGIYQGPSGADSYPATDLLIDRRGRIVVSAGRALLRFLP